MVDQVQVVAAVAMDLVWAAVVAVTLLKCNTPTAVTSLQDLLSLLFVLVLLADVPAVVVAMVEPVVDSMDVLLSS